MLLAPTAALSCDVAAIIAARCPTAPWLAHYDPGVPATLAPYPDRTLARLSRRRARARPAERAALLFKGATHHLGRSSTALSDACAARAPGARRDARRPRRRCCCRTVRSSSSRSSAPGRSARSSRRSTRSYTERELEGPLRDHGIETIVTLTRFYERVKRVQRAHAAAARHRDQHQGVLSAAAALAVHAGRARRRDGDRVALAPGDHDFGDLLLGHRGRHAAGERCAPPTTIRPCCC